MYGSITAYDQMRSLVRTPLPCSALLTQPLLSVKALSL